MSLHVPQPGRDDDTLSSVLIGFFLGLIVAALPFLVRWALFE
jgi:hypothetical protein